MEEADCVTRPRAFAEANSRVRGEYLRSLTLERAAEILEALLELGPDFRPVKGMPPPLPNPLPRTSAAILIEGRLEDDF